jgi:hypothetical protein
MTDPDPLSPKTYGIGSTTLIRAHTYQGDDHIVSSIYSTGVVRPKFPPNGTQCEESIPQLPSHPFGGRGDIHTKYDTFASYKI